MGPTRLPWHREQRCGVCGWKYLRHLECRWNGSCSAFADGSRKDGPDQLVRAGDEQVIGETPLRFSGAGRIEERLSWRKVSVSPVGDGQRVKPEWDSEPRCRVLRESSVKGKYDRTNPG